MRVLLTGGAGFIGSHVLKGILNRFDWNIVLLDRLDSSGNLNRLSELGVDQERVSFVYHDLKAPIVGLLAKQLGRFDLILHLAAGTHVDRSIEAPLEFVMDNVVGTCNLLDFARNSGLASHGIFMYFSTDEVFGPAPPGVAYKENDRYNSGNPYAATKAGAEELVVAYANTYGIKTMITHTMNVIGTMQHPEKFVPMVISKVRDDELVLIHADKTCTKPGSRFYIDADDVADALIWLIGFGRCGEKYNIVGEREVDNLALAGMIARAMDRTLSYQLVDFHSSRPGHDLRYALDGSKMAELGWYPKRSIEESIQKIVDWSLAHPNWLSEPVIKFASKQGVRA